MAGLLVLLLWLLTGAAVAKPLWHDEIYTVLLARLPSAGAIWAAHRDGADLQPPLNTLLTALAERTWGAGPVSSRFPPLVGFVLMTCVITAMLRRRAGMTLAFAGALIPAQTAAYRYAYEARGYGVMVGLFALALFAWAEAARGHRRWLWIPVCAAALGLAVWAHYYAAFGFVVIGAGELVRTIRARRIDGSMIGGLAAGGLLTLPLIPLITSAAEQAPRFWARAGDEQITGAYWFLFQPVTALLWGRLGALVLLALAWTALTRHRRRRAGRVPEPPPAGEDPLPVHEMVALLVTVASPMVMLMVARATHAPFVPRYGLIAVVGVALALPLLVRRLAPRGSLAEVILLLLLSAPLAQGIAARDRPRTSPDPFAERPLLVEALRRSRPVVASGSLTYLQLWYYAPPEDRAHLVYLADPDAALRFTGADTIDRGYLALARWTTLPVERYSEFVAAHPEFTVYTAGSGWLLIALEEQGTSIAPRGSEPGGREFRVTR